MGADIIALPHALRGVVVFPKYLQNFVKGNQLRVKHHLHHFIMAGLAAAYFFIARIGRKTRCIADLRGINALSLPKFALCPPKATHADNHRLHSVRPGRNHWRAQYKMLFRHRHVHVAPGQRRLLVYHFSFFHSKHDASLLDV